MIPYLLLLVVSVSSLFYLETYMNDDKNYAKYLKLYFVLLATVMIALGTLRAYSVGADTSTYLEYFTSDFYYKIEIGYIFLSRMISMMGFSFRVMLFVVQSIVVLPILYIIYKSTKMKWLSVFLYQGFYLYVNSFNILRQSIAMSLVLVAAYILIEMSKGSKRNIMFLGTLILATLFHTSAIMFIVLWPLKEYRPKLSQLVAVFIVSLIIMVFREPILTYIFTLLNRPYITNFSIDLGYSTIALLALFLGLVLTGDYMKNTISGSTRFVINLLVGALFFNLVWAWFPNHARITMYIYLILSVFYPNVLFEQKDAKYFHMKVLTIVVAILGLYLIQLNFRDYGQVVPYLLFFTN